MGLFSLFRNRSVNAGGADDDHAGTQEPTCAADGAPGEGDAPNAPVIRRRYRFVGEVQAVGFRWNTSNLAKASGATGWVRNERDGSVTAELQGTAQQVDAVIQGLRRHYNESSWSAGFRVATQEGLPLVSDERAFKVTYV